MAHLLRRLARHPVILGLPAKHELHRLPEAEQSSPGTASSSGASPTSAIGSSNSAAIGCLAPALLCLVFRATIEKLIHLYTFGVFAAFTLMQDGMARHWWSRGHPAGTSVL